MIRYIRYSVVLFVVLMCLYPLGVKADTIAYLSYGKLWVYEAGKSRLVSDAYQYVDVKWYKKPTVAAVRAGNIELVNTTSGRSEKLTSIGNIRNILVLPGKNKIIFTRIVGGGGWSRFDFELSSLDLGKKKVTKIGKLVQADTIANMVLIGGNIYYLPTTREEDWDTPVIRFSLTSGDSKKIWDTGMDEMLAMCLDQIGKQLVMIGCRWGEYGFQMPPLDYFIARLNPQKPVVAICHRFDRTFLRLASAGEGYEEVDGCCVLSDGSLVFGVRSFREYGPEHESSKLCRFSFESGETTQIANGYRPDAISE